MGREKTLKRILKYNTIPSYPHDKAKGEIFKKKNVKTKSKSYNSELADIMNML